MKVLQLDTCAFLYFLLVCNFRVFTILQFCGFVFLRLYGFMIYSFTILQYYSFTQLYGFTALRMYNFTVLQFSVVRVCGCTVLQTVELYNCKVSNCQNCKNVKLQTLNPKGVEPQKFKNAKLKNDSKDVAPRAARSV